jgi:AcrR family transcriptional regulator
MPTSVPEKVLKAAARLFAENGFERTAMNDIAKRAKVALPTIYLHFGNKRNLYNAACTSVFSSKAREHWALLKGPPDGSDHKRLYRYLTALAHDFMNDPVYSNLMHRELTDRSTIGLKELSQHSFAYAYAELCLLCGRLFPNRDSAVLALALHSLVFGLVNFLRFAVHMEPQLSEKQTPAEVAKIAVSELMPDVDWDQVLNERNNKTVKKAAGKISKRKPPKS